MLFNIFSGSGDDWECYADGLPLAPNHRRVRLLARLVRVLVRTCAVHALFRPRNPPIFLAPTNWLRLGLGHCGRADRTNADFDRVGDGRG